MENILSRQINAGTFTSYGLKDDIIFLTLILNPILPLKANDISQ